MNADPDNRPPRPVRRLRTTGSARLSDAMHKLARGGAVMRELRPRRITGAIAAGVLLGAGALLVLPGEPATADITTQPTQTFSSAGTYYVTVPGTLDYVDLHGLGGAGFGGDDSSSKWSRGGAGGSGTDVRVHVGNQLGGHQLKIVVGAKGGGGQRGYGSQLSGSGGNGGGATVITDVTAGDVLLVAGGGGGGGGGSGLYIGYDGGNGGTNGNGTPGIGTFGADAGRGGAAGQVTNCGLSWVAPGEAGETAPSGSAVAGGGGGGEGACGGGGQGGGSGEHAAGSGGGGGGGAGASYADDFGTDAQIKSGGNTGDGSASVTFTTYVTHSPTITSPSCIYAGNLSAPTYLSQSLTAVGYPAPTFTLLNAPAWLAIFGESQIVTGVTTATLHADGPVPSPQQYRMQVQATNSVGSIIDPLTLVVGVDHPEFTSPSTATATVGEPFSFKATDLGCPVAIGYSLINTDPDASWLTINSATGEMSGTPTAAAVGTHTFAITASDPAGQSVNQVFTLDVKAAPATTPGTPADVRATGGNGSAVVSFTPPASDGGSAITGYTVTATDQTMAGNGGQMATGSGSPITISGLTNGDSYTFTVTATNSAGESPASGPSNAAIPATVPDPPTAVSASAANGSAVVSFSPPSADGGSAITGYTATAVDHTAAGNGGQTATGSGSPITISGLTSGDSYTFTVTAKNSVGSSEPSSQSAPVMPARIVTTTKLSSSENPVNAGQKVTFTATISPADATGAVDFTGPDGTGLPGCDAQPVESGVATCDHTFPAAGRYAVTATYSGDATSAGSSDRQTQEVHGVHPPTTTITVSPAGLSTGPVRVAISATGVQSTITTRCVLDPAKAPTSYADLPSRRCRYLGKGSKVGANGKHTVRGQPRLGREHRGDRTLDGVHDRPRCAGVDCACRAGIGSRRRAIGAHTRRRHRARQPTGQGRHYRGGGLLEQRRHQAPNVRYRPWIRRGRSHLRRHRRPDHHADHDGHAADEPHDHQAGLHDGDLLRHR